MPIAPILLFLKSNWKWIAVGIVITSLGAYIETIRLEEQHYKSKVGHLQLEIDTAKKKADAKEQQLQADAEALTAKYHSALKDANTLTTENARLNAENIAKDKELTATRLSLNAIRLFNASKQSEQNSTAEAKPGDDGTTATLAKALEEKSQTLADLLQVVNINDANHLKCIATVEAWQKFWSEYEASVEAVNAGNN